MKRQRWVWRAIVLLIVAASAVAVVLSTSQQARETLASQLARHLPELRAHLAQQNVQPIAMRLAASGFTLGQPALIRLFKDESSLELWIKRGSRFELFHSYPICKWSGTLGPKLQEGDGQSPEGFYEVSARQLLPTSRHHRALNTGFPNAFDQALGRTGSVLMIHGSCLSIGCYAMTDAGIDDIYTIVEAALSNGQPTVPLQLFPFRLTSENLALHRAEKWHDFWRNLAEGDSEFQRTHMPVAAYACNGRYEFNINKPGCQKIAAW